MHVTKSMLDKQLRLPAALIGWTNRNTTEAKLRKNHGKPSFVQKLITRFLKPSHTQTEEIQIPRGDGTHIRTLITKPTNNTTKTSTTETKNKRPVILWIHGGGYFSGSPEAEIGVADYYSHQQGCIMVVPDYRLSLDAPYPAALDDCYTALLWIKDNCEKLNARDDQIIIIGGSAGGGLTAALTLLARDKGEVNIAFQMPICPMLDDRETPSCKDNNAPFWDANNNRLGWQLYLGDFYGSDDVPAYAAAARATDFSNLPPTLTYVGGIEPFLDETVNYAEALKAAGVSVSCRVFDGGFHGFDAIVPYAKISKEAAQFRNQWFEAALTQYFAPQPTTPNHQ